MAGSITPLKIEHRSRGVVRTDVTITTGTDGSAPAETVVGVGFGRLVGVAVKGPASVAITVKDKKTGATVLNAYRPTTAVFGNTTTGDETGGAVDDLFTTGAAHGLTELDEIVFTSQTGSTLPALNTPYYVAETTGFAATTFCLAASAAEAAAGAGQVIVELDADISAATWYKKGAAVTPVLFRPTTVIADNAGTAVSAADTAPNVNRDIYVGGKLSVSTTGGATSSACTLSLIVDEEGIGDLAVTV